ncbi:hypothetical protein EDC01DRAFT_745334, partial [Geopyxis carbonaria]
KGPRAERYGRFEYKYPSSRIPIDIPSTFTYTHTFLSTIKSQSSTTMQFTLRPLLFLTVLTLVSTLTLGSPLATQQPDQSADLILSSDVSDNNAVNTTSPIPSDLDVDAADVGARFTGTVKCDTTAGSPRLHDIDTVIRMVRQRRDCGKRTNGCFQIARHGPHAAVSICGRPWFEFPSNCAQIAGHLQQIKNKCTWTRYAGGRFVMKDTWIALHK